MRKRSGFLADFLRPGGGKTINPADFWPLVGKVAANYWSDACIIVKKQIKSGHVWQELA
ncbi:MAG TPA: hypothetical protein VJZ49_03485 [Syntrophales bacterium]|nr:hypothetical protein [Syntrophales bacterium]